MCKVHLQNESEHILAKGANTLHYVANLSISRLNGAEVHVCESRDLYVGVWQLKMMALQV